jgi:hypothetical protein
MRTSLYLFGLLLLSLPTLAQSPFVPLNADYYHLIDRYEIRQGHWAEGFHSTTKPYNRQSVVQLTDSLLAHPAPDFSDTDYFNLNYLRDDSWEWVKDPVNDSTRQNLFTRHLQAPAAPGDSRKPLFGVFYKKKSDFYNLQSPDFDLHVSPVVNFGIGIDNTTGLPDNTSALNQQTFINTRGLEIRGSIAKKIGFYSYFADNQAIYPYYINDQSRLYLRSGQTAGYAPGESFSKPFGAGGRGTDFLTARGYFTFNIAKIINLQFGHDRNFIGNGFRSLLLSDNAAPYLFLKLTTRLGKNIQYTNLFTELQNTQALVANVNMLNPNKYAAMHHLSINISPKFNLGVFEAELFSRDRLELNYLNPIIFYRFVESYRGSTDNAMIGLDFKANLATHFLFYTQFLLDEFVLKDILSGNGSYTNKFAFQLGGKYIDVLNVPNLDLQVEMNLARPYTYSHKATPDLGITASQANYVHYSQPMAHPLGANFMEGIGIVRYQNKRLSGTGTFSVMMYGTDPPGRNYGGNILLDYETNFRDYGNFIGQGRKTIATYADLRASYMIKHNVFLEGRLLYRFQDSQYRPDSYTDRTASIALRWNVPYRSLVF